MPPTAPSIRSEMRRLGRVNTLILAKLKAILVLLS